MKLDMAALGAPKALRGALIALGAVLAAGAMAGSASAQPAAKPWYKTPWDPARAQPCDRACLVSIMSDYLHALETKDRSALPLAEQVWLTENSAHMDLGEGLLWRAKLQPTAFRVDVADPVSGQIATQIVYNLEGRPALVAIRLMVERHMITQVEELYDRNVAPQAMELLQTPRPGLLNDVPAGEKNSREYLAYAANAYFDALTGEDGKIAPFADDCVRHEQGYQTVNNAKPGRAAPSPALPDPSTPMGKFFSELSTMTCSQQISTGVFTGIKRIWPRRLVIDEQKGLVAVFPLFVHDGTHREDPNATSPQGGLGMVINLDTMETFGVRGGKIHEVEAFPFVTLPYGLGDGWTNAVAH
ncbi:MAG: hypothetical protein WDM92_08735 [Caulobacteraceae bacterium]